MVVAALLAMLGFIAPLSSASASTLFGTIFGTPSPLYRGNQSTGAFSSIGNSGFSSVGDLTSNPATGLVLGINIESNQLLSFNTTTGAASVVSTITGANAITSIAINPIDGLLYGNESVNFSAVPGDTLYRINPSTGVATQVGRINFNNVYALAFSNSGTLLGVSDDTKQLIRINTTTGAGSAIGNTGRNAIYDLATRPEDGVVFAADSFPAFGTGGTYSLYTIDTTTAATTLVGSFGSPINIAGLAFIPAPSSIVALLTFGVPTLVRPRR